LPEAGVAAEAAAAGVDGPAAAVGVLCGSSEAGARGARSVTVSISAPSAAGSAAGGDAGAAAGAAAGGDAGGEGGDSGGDAGVEGGAAAAACRLAMLRAVMASCASICRRSKSESFSRSSLELGIMMYASLPKYSGNNSSFVLSILRSSLCTSARTRRSCRAAVRSIERLAAVPRITDPLNWPWVYVLGG